MSTLTAFSRLATAAAAPFALAAAGLVALSAPPAQAQATIAVTTVAVGVNEGDGACSFIEAIYAANYDNNIAIKTAVPETWVTTECTPGSGADTIQLPAGGVFNVSSPIDDLYNPLGPSAFPIVFTPITIEGNGARIERTGADHLRAFSVLAASMDLNPGGSPNVVYQQGDLTIRNLHVKGFYARGGDGGQLGGGGGLGAGGAIYVRRAILSVDASTFEANRAEGGNGGNALNAISSTGSAFTTGGGGGGGGLSGAGGRGSSTSGPGGGGGGASGSGGAGDYDGGGGGGTITDGAFGASLANIGAEGGLVCGGRGGFEKASAPPYPTRTGAEDGGNGCDGGGGGGAAQPYDPAFGFCCEGHPGDGGYGGGGGGGGESEYQGAAVDGGAGGFGGGGGGGGQGANGGAGGFGAGGGGGFTNGGDGGTFGGHGGRNSGAYDFPVIAAGGGGAGLGGAIFSDDGTVTVANSTFTENSVSHGFAGANEIGARNGSDTGAAIFAVDGYLTVNSSTVSGNESTGAGAGITMYRSSRDYYQATLKLSNTIVAGNLPQTDECELIGSVSASGSNNLFTDNLNCPSSAAVNGDPLLKPLSIEAPGTTPTLAIDDTSPAYDAGQDGSCEQFDQRGVSRPRSLHCDIGAYEYIKPSADLAAATTTSGPAVAGTTSDYLIEVHNNGPTAAENVTVTDTLPSGTTFVGITGSGGFSCTGAGPVTCTKAIMNEGATALFTLTVDLPATLANGTSLTNAVTVSSSTTPDPSPANNTASVSNAVTTRADVAVTKTGPTNPVAGTDQTYTITVSNQGPSAARTVNVGDQIPAGTAFQALSVPSGWSCIKPAVGTPGPTSTTCTVSMLSPGVSVSFTLTLHIAAAAAEGTDLCNMATVSTTTSDPLTLNNSSRTCGTIWARADLRVTQTASTTGKPGKGTATFTITVTNLGPSDSQHVALAATSSVFGGPPPSLTATAGASCSVAGSTVTCTWATVTSGTSVQAVISVPWRSSVGSTCVSTSVSAGTSDPVASNNSGGVCIAKR